MTRPAAETVKTAPITTTENNTKRKLLKDAKYGHRPIIPCSSSLNYVEGRDVNEWRMLEAFPAITSKIKLSLN